MKAKAIHILLVEDDVSHAELIRQAFVRRAPETQLTIAHTLDQARAVLTTSYPDLIISDLRLPDGDGVALLPADRNHAPYPVIIMTSHGDEQVAVEAMKAGALDYVVKTQTTLMEMPRIAERARREWGHIIDCQRAEAMVLEAKEDLLRQQRREKEHIEQELQKAESRLIRQTRLATIGQVAASIAHELRNPLGAVRNATYYLKRRVPPDDPTWIEYLALIESEVITAERIIRTLLEMSRTAEPKVQTIDLHRAIREAFGRLEDTGALNLHCTLDPDPYMVMVDPEQFRQVLVNLLTNAAQAMHGNGHINVTAASDDTYDVITIEDDGPGIDEELRASIFEPLFTTKAKGTGLGLPICRQFIERHGGTLNLTETPDTGAAFCIRLPRRKIHATEKIMKG